MTAKGGWTVETLKEHFEKLLAEKDKTLQVTQDAAKEAVGVAEESAKNWRSDANEWRAAMNDRENKFLHTTVFETYKEGADKAEVARKEYEAERKGKEIGKRDIIAIVVSVAAIVGVVMGIIFKFIGK